MKRACLTVAASIVLTGLAAAIYGANAAPWPDAPSVMVIGAAMVACIPASAAAMFGIARVAAWVWRKAQDILLALLTLVAGVAALCVAGMVLVGWLRIVGIQVLETFPAVASPIVGIGFAVAVAGILLFGWCATPLTAENDPDDPHRNKRGVVFMLCYFFVLLPAVVSLAGTPDGRHEKERDTSTVVERARIPSDGN